MNGLMEDIQIARSENEANVVLVGVFSKDMEPGNIYGFKPFMSTDEFMSALGKAYDEDTDTYNLYEDNLNVIEINRTYKSLGFDMGATAKKYRELNREQGYIIVMYALHYSGDRLIGQSLVV